MRTERSWTMFTAQYNFFFNDTATTEIYTLSLHDALPICTSRCTIPKRFRTFRIARMRLPETISPAPSPRSHRQSCFDGERSEEHTSELQSRQYLVCRLLLEKKKHRIKTSVQRESHTSDNR